MAIDTTPRYVPYYVMTQKGMTPVSGVVAYPPNTHPQHCPLVKNCTAIDVQTPAGSRWYGVESAHINSELRMVISGFPEAFEELRAWDICNVA